MFLSNDTRIVSLDDAGKWLLGGPVARPGETEAKAQASFKSRVRRLYDIANVFTSLELIEKIHLVQTRKPAFKWLGARVYPLPSSVPREAYTSDAPTRRPNTKPGFDALFPLPMNMFAPITNTLHAQPPPVPRRATLDTAELAAVAKASAAATNPSDSLRLISSSASTQRVPAHIASLEQSFIEFDAIQHKRSLDRRVPPGVGAGVGVDVGAGRPPKRPSPPPTAATRTESKVRIAQRSDLMQMAAANTDKDKPSPFDPLLLAYARVPPVSSGPARPESSAALSTRLGFTISDTAYIRDSSDFIQHYRAACGEWQKRIPTYKAMYLKYTLAPPQMTTATMTQATTQSVK